LSDPDFADLEGHRSRLGASSGRAALPRRLLFLERTLLASGALLLLVFAAARLHAAVSRQVDLAAFNLARAAQAGVLPSDPVDQSLWSEGRIAKYRESLSRSFAPPMAVLRSPRLGIEVPVLPGTDDLTLNRAVGHIEGTASPGDPGNVVIAGHRDGFFRGLKDVALGDRFELETLAGKRLYGVTSIQIVRPTDLEVLDPTPVPALTLVTCYPFYYVGKAPERFIVRAGLLPASEAGEARQGR